MSNTENINENSAIHFAEGIMGFEDYKDYLIMAEEDTDYMMILQSVDNKNISFVVVDPFSVLDRYDPEITGQDLKYFGENCDLKYLLVAVIPSDVSKTAVNLKSPIVIDSKTKKAKQVILENKNYPIRYFLFE